MEKLNKKNVNTKKFISWLRKQDSTFKKDVIENMNFPTQMKEIMILKVIKYNSNNDIIKKTKLSQDQISYRVKIAVDIMLESLEDYLIDTKIFLKNS